MDRLEWGMRSSSGLAALAMGICSIDDESGNGGGGGGGAGGGAAELLDDDAGATGGDQGAGDQGAGGQGAGDQGAGGQGAGDQGAGGAVAPWMKQFSAEAPAAGELSNQDWLAKWNVKDLDGVVALAREQQKALRDSGRVKIPGPDAKPAELAAFREAMGVPESADGYEIKLPDGIDGEKFELDGGLLDPLRAVALEHNVPKGAFEAIAGAFMAKQAELAIETAAANDQAKGEKIKEWGANAAARQEEFRRAAKGLGLDKAAIGRLQAGFGVGETMDLIAKIGGMMGEDFFASGDAAQRFGVASSADAQKQLDAMAADPKVAAALRNRTDKAAVDRWNRLTEAKAHWLEIEKGRK